MYFWIKCDFAQDYAKPWLIFQVYYRLTSGTWISPGSFNKKLKAFIIVSQPIDLQSVLKRTRNRKYSFIAGTAKSLNIVLRFGQCWTRKEWIWNQLFRWLKLQIVWTNNNLAVNWAQQLSSKLITVLKHWKIQRFEHTSTLFFLYTFR